MSAQSRELKIGDVVLISDPSEGIGVVRHIDEIQYVVGIELTDPLGNSDGSLHGEPLFKCRPKYGIFVSVRDIQRLVSPEELLHKIVVLNRALAHKHSTLSAQTQTIDTLKQQVASLKQQMHSLKRHHTHHDHDHDHAHGDADHHNGYVSSKTGTTSMPSILLQQIQNQRHRHAQQQQQPHHLPSNNGHYGYTASHSSTSRPSKPHTPEREKVAELLTTGTTTDTSSVSHHSHSHSAHSHSREAMALIVGHGHRTLLGDTHSLSSASSSHASLDQHHDDADEHAAASSSSSATDDAHHAHADKPRSQPPSRRASFLSNVDANHPYGDNIVSRALILNRGKKISSALTDYMHRDRVSTETKPKTKANKHARHLSNEQLGLLAVAQHANMTPANSANVMTSHSHSQHAMMRMAADEVDSSPHSSSHPQSHATHRKQLSNVDLAAQILNQQVQQATKALKQQYHDKYRAFNDDDGEEDEEEEDDNGVVLQIARTAPAVNTSVSMITHLTDEEEEEEEEDGEDDVLDDESFQAMSNRFNESIGNHTNVPAMPAQQQQTQTPMHYKHNRARKSQSQPVSPKHYLDAFNFNGAQNALPRQQQQQPVARNQMQMQQPAMFTMNSQPPTGNASSSGDAQLPLRVPRLQMGSISTRSNLPAGFEFPRRHRTATVGAAAGAELQSSLNGGGASQHQSPLKASSAWRKNRDAFLKQMDRKLEAAMTKFAAKDAAARGGDGDNNNEAVPILTRPISARKFGGAPLTRKRGHSYHHGSTEMQRIREASWMQTQQQSQSSQPSQHPRHRPQLSAMMVSSSGNTRTTTFSAYTQHNKVSADNQQMLELLKPRNAPTQPPQTQPPQAQDVDVLFDGRQPSFRLKQRRSISLPSSPKSTLKTMESRLDALDLGDDMSLVADTPRETTQTPIRMQDDDDDDDDDGDDVVEVELQVERPMEVISDESSLADADDTEDVDVEQVDETQLARQGSEPISLDRRIHRRRLRMGVKGKTANVYSHEAQQRSTIRMYDASTMQEAMIVQSDDDDDAEIKEEEQLPVVTQRASQSRTPFGQRNRRRVRARTYFKDDSDSDSEKDEISNTDQEEEETQQSDLDEDAYKYYQTKKRNSQVNVFAKQELEQEYNSIFQ